MIRFWVLFFITSFFVGVVKGYDTVECNFATPIYTIQSNSYTLVQSPNFPQSFLYSIHNGSCRIQLVTNISDSFIWIAMFNGASDEIQLIDDNSSGNKLNIKYYSSNYDTVSFSTKSSSLSIHVNGSQYPDSWSAFQAAAFVFPKSMKKSTCPLTSQIFDLKTNPTQIIPISPTFGTNETILQQKTCTWKFTIDSSQRLKVVPIKMNAVQGITVILNNEKSILKKQVFLFLGKYLNIFEHFSFTLKDTGKAFYFSGLNFNLTYDFNFASNFDPAFFFLVSAVTQPKNYSNTGCRQEPNGQTITFTNRDLKNGYPPNQLCSSTITIPDSKEAKLSFKDIDFEIFSDKFTLTQGNKTFQIKPPKKYGFDYSYKLTSDVKEGQLTFTSDENIQGAGYSLELEVYECKCSDLKIMIPCDNETAKFWPMTTSNPYCSKMDCNYTILLNPNCSDTYFNLKITNELRDSIDYIILRRNGISDLNVTSKQNYKLNRYYNPSSNIAIHFHSGPSPDIVTSESQQWYFEITAIPQPKFMQIGLNGTNSKHIQWLEDLNENDALTVCTSAGTLELFVTVENADLSKFLLFDANDLYNFVGSLSSSDMLPPSDPWLPFSIKSNSKCFTLFVSEKSYAKGYTALFRISEYYYLNCIGSNSVFQVPYTNTNPSEFDVTVKSTGIGWCEMTILSATGYSSDLPHIWITNVSADLDAIYSFKSTINDKKLLDLDGFEASKWKYFGIFTPSLTIVVPPSKQITVHLSYYYQLLQKITIVENSTQKGIMVSPSYSGFMKSFDNAFLYSSDISASEFLLYLNVKDIYGTLNPVLESNGKRITINQSINLTTSQFDLYFNEFDKSEEENGFLIEYTIEPIATNQINPTKPTTSSTSDSKLGIAVFIIPTLALILL